MPITLTSPQMLDEYLLDLGLTWERAQLPPREWLESLTFPLRLPKEYADLINWTNPLDPLRLMVIPDPAEAHIAQYELSDPIGDTAREAVPGLIHRYPDRCLLLLTSHCLVHCRFCFRREVVGKVRPVAFKRIAQYLQAHTEIHEVIFSGGDPATFPAGFIQTLVNELGDIQHITRWRFHTRVPAVEPTAITDEWLSTISKLPGKKIVAIHINHPREITPALSTLIKKMLGLNILLLSQTVLLKGVNDNAETLKELFENLVTTGVKPYYLHHLDQAHGTSHFRISIEEGKKLYRQLRGHLSSVCLPEYVLDLPQGKDKVPVMWFEETAPGIYRTTSFEGEVVEYIDQTCQP